MPGLLLDTLRGKVTERPPVWLMRQAGRYLPEYRALRAEKGGFLELVYDSHAAAEITLQPVRRFGFDGAILFSDILIVPYAMGQDLAFLAGEGPRLSPPLIDAALDALEAVPDFSRSEQGPKRSPTRRRFRVNDSLSPLSGGCANPAPCQAKARARIGP